MVPLPLGHPLILYLAVQEASIGCMLDQLNEPDQKEKAIYYLSKKFTSCEINYIDIEKMCASMGLVQVTAVYALLRHAVVFSHGSHQIHL